MNIIKTKAQHRDALNQIERLMDNPKLSPALAKKLSQLSTAVEAYEDKHYPMGEPVYVRAKELFKLVYGRISGQIFDVLYSRQNGWRRLSKHVLFLESESAKWKQQCQELMKTRKALLEEKEELLAQSAKKFLRNETDH